VTLLPAGNPSLWTGPTGTNTYLLPGRVRTLIDAGVGEPSHLAALEAALDGRPLDQVLLTHSHVDHASGVPAVLARWPAARVRPASEPFEDGTQIAAGDGTLTVVRTPGHAPDHVCFVDVATREVYCGDLARTGGTIVIPASRGGDLREYLSSLRRIRELRPRRLLPGHGPAIEEPERVIDEYFAHRALRESQVIEALRRGLLTPAEMVDEVYGKLPGMLAAAAADSLLAHLKKLEAEGMVELSGGRWRILRSPGP
jgi:glyoxylase-like metal-dependent hydrolase (beta-lactamase superfamily II)